MSQHHSSLQTRTPAGATRTRVRARTAIVAGLLAFGALLASAPAASAHDKLKSTSPEEGSSVATPPAAITLTFSEPVFKLGSRIRVTGPAGDVAAGAPVFADRVVRQALQPGSPAGAYTVEWQVTSADGHPIAGRWSFTAQGADASTPAATTPAATTAATTAPAGPPTPSASTVRTANADAATDGSPSTGIVVGVTAAVAVLLLAAAGGVALTRRRGR